MRRIESIEQYNTIFSASVKRPFETNFFVIPGAIKEYIENSRLYYCDLETGDGVAFYEDRGSFYKLYYFINKSGEFVIAAKDKPVVADIVYSESKGVSKVSTEFMEISGFEKLRVLRQFSANKEDLAFSTKALPDGYSIEATKKERIHDVMLLLNSTFDAVKADTPDEAELLQTAEEKSSVCLISQTGKLCGYCQCKSSTGAYIQFVTIIPELHGKGFGKKLLCESMKKINVKGYKSWIAENNAASERLHTSVGFKLTDKRKIKYILGV